MVLCGAQFQRSGPAGCKFRTRRALSSYRVTSVHGRSDAACLEQGGRVTQRRLTPFHGSDQCWQPHKGLAPHGARG